MNIVIISQMFAPARTGTAVYATNLARHLAFLGHNVDVMTASERGYSCDSSHFGLHKLSAIRIPLRGFFKHLSFVSLNVFNYYRALKLAKGNNADVVLVINHYLDGIFIGIFLSRVMRLPLICAVGTPLQSVNLWRNFLLKIMDKIVCGIFVFPFVTKIIAWDKEIARYLSDRYRDRFVKKVQIVNYGVGGDLASYKLTKSDFKRHNSLLAVGAVSEQRTFIPLVMAVSLLTRDIPDIKLKIVGHVYFEEAVKLTHKLRLSENISFVGELPHTKVLDEMRSSDLLYQSITGQYLGLGTAPLEAMTVGLPTVLNTPSNILGSAKLIDGEHYIKCLSTEPKVIASKIHRLLKDEKLRRQLSMNAKLFVERHMSWDKIATDYTQIFDSVRGRHH